MRASGSSRFLACPGSVRIPATRVRSPSLIDACDYGTMVHYWKEHGIIPPDADPKHKALLERKLSFTGDFREKFWPSTGMHEVTYALNLITLRVLKYQPAADTTADSWKKGFDEAKYLTGTIDYVAEDRIDDLKTGAWPVSAEDNKQLKSYATFVWIELGRPHPWSIETSITQWPRYPLKALPRVTSVMVSSLELEEHVDDLRWSVLHPDLLVPDGTDEDHCKFCDSRPGCPAWLDTGNVT